MNKIISKFKDCSVLFAEDHDIDREIIKEMLSYMNISVDVAKNGKDALTLFEKNDYDIIFVDIQMPLMDGFEMTSHIRKSNKKQPVIIAITAKAMKGDKENCLEAGMDDYLPKPIDINSLEKMIKKYFPDKLMKEN